MVVDDKPGGTGTAGLNPERWVVGRRYAAGSLFLANAGSSETAARVRPMCLARLRLRRMVGAR